MFGANFLTKRWEVTDNKVGPTLHRPRTMVQRVRPTVQRAAATVPAPPGNHSAGPGSRSAGLNQPFRRPGQPSSGARQAMPQLDFGRIYQCITSANLNPLHFFTSPPILIQISLPEHFVSLFSPSTKPCIAFEIIPPYSSPKQ
jgi:hypothetical protein